MPPYDAAWKLLFSHPELVHDLLAGFLPREWVAELDLATLERWPESSVSDDLRERHRDRVLRMHRREPEPGHWLYLLVLLEFQSTVDRTMAVRILVYTALLYQDLLRVAPSEPLPLVLPIVLYHGRAPWTAPEEVAGLSSAYSNFLAPYQPPQRYFLFDVGGYTGPLPQERNLMAALIRLTHSRTRQDVAAVFETLAEWLSGPEHKGLRRAFVEWARLVQVPARGSAGQRPVLDERWSEGKAMRHVLNEWTRGGSKKVGRRAESKEGKRARPKGRRKVGPRAEARVRRRSCAGWRLGSSTPRRSSGSPGGWPRSPTRSAWARSASGSSSVKTPTRCLSGFRSCASPHRIGMTDRRSSGLPSIS